MTKRITALVFTLLIATSATAAPIKTIQPMDANPCLFGCRY